MTRAFDRLEIYLALVTARLPATGTVRLPSVLVVVDREANALEIALENRLYHCLDMAGLHRVENFELLSELQASIDMDQTNSWRFGRFALSIDPGKIAQLRMLWPFDAQYYDIRDLTDEYAKQSV